MEDFLEGLDQIEKTQNVIFTFNPTRGDYHEVSLFMPENEVYSINYQIGNEGNAIHESTHAIQVYRMNYLDVQMMTRGEMEMNAYSTQYSYSPRSISALYNSSGISPSSRIPLVWVKGLYLINESKKVYPYEKYK